MYLDGKIITQLCLLSYLVAPKGRIRRSKKPDWKFSMSESEKSIVQHSQVSLTSIILN